VIAFVCDAIRKMVSGAIRRPASLSLHPTARSYTGWPSCSTSATAPAMRPSSAYCCSRLSMRAARPVEKASVGFAAGGDCADGAAARRVAAESRSSALLISPSSPLAHFNSPESQCSTLSAN
jgi:hypothetical protein